VAVLIAIGAVVVAAFVGGFIALACLSVGGGDPVLDDFEGGRE
jgi:hypothetical protein